MTIERDAPSIARITAWLARQAELALAESDLSLPQYRVLALLADGMALPSSMADSLDVRRPSITAVVDGLVTRGYVVREHDPADRRKVTHAITPAGRRVLVTADCAVDRRLREIAGTLEDPKQVAAALAGLASWRPALQAWRARRKADKATTAELQLHRRGGAQLPEATPAKATPAKATPAKAASAGAGRSGS